jgi:hypothetical protein
VPTTPVRMADSRLVPIAKINPGDEILSLEEKTGHLVPVRVERRLDHTVQTITTLRFANGEMIHTTPRHRFMTSSGELIAAAKLAAGHDLRTYNRRKARIAEITKRDGNAVVHNLVLEGGRNYLVGAYGLVADVVKEKPETPFEDFEETADIKPVPQRKGRPKVGPQPPRKRVAVAAKQASRRSRSPA